MSANTTVAELLEQWSKHREQGGVVAPEVLCEHCPELLEELRLRIAGHVSDVTDGLTVVEPLRGPLMVGRYRLEEKLGAGGFGSVYRGFDSRPRRLRSLMDAPPNRDEKVRPSTGPLRICYPQRI
jgi:hypothetical protein